MTDDIRDPEETRDFVFYQSGKTADPTRKQKAWILLAEGKSLRDVESTTGYGRGTLSKWRRSPAFAKWFADHGGVPHTPLIKKERPVKKSAKKKRRMGKRKEDEDVIRGKFFQSCAVGGLHWAQQYSGANDHQVAMFLRELGVNSAVAKPRIKVLSEMLAIGLSDQVNPSVRVKALADWWRLADNMIGTEALVHIDARSGDTSGPSPTQHMLKEIQRQLMDAKEVILDAKAIGVTDIDQGEEDA